MYFSTYYELSLLLANDSRGNAVSTSVTNESCRFTAMKSCLFFMTHIIHQPSHNFAKISLPDFTLEVQSDINEKFTTAIADFLQ